MASIDVLEKEIPVEFEVGEGATAADLDQAGLIAGADDMADLINSIDWPPHYRDAFRGMKKIVFFAGKVVVDNNLMDRPCCDQDDAIFYWEAEEFFRNTDADVHANTFFHDCWHLVQYKAAGNKYAYTLTEQIDREVDAITHQITVAHMLGCSDREGAVPRRFPRQSARNRDAARRRGERPGPAQAGRNVRAGGRLARSGIAAALFRLQT